MTLRARDVYKRQDVFIRQESKQSASHTEYDSPVGENGEPFDIGTDIVRTGAVSYTHLTGVMTFTMILLPQTLANALVLEISPRCV